MCVSDVTIFNGQDSTMILLWSLNWVISKHDEPCPRFWIHSHVSCHSTREANSGGQGGWVGSCGKKGSSPTHFHAQQTANLKQQFAFLEGRRLPGLNTFLGHFHCSSRTAKPPSCPLLTVCGSRWTKLKLQVWIVSCLPWRPSARHRMKTSDWTGSPTEAAAAEAMTPEWGLLRGDKGLGPEGSLLQF